MKSTGIAAVFCLALLALSAGTTVVGDPTDPLQENGVRATSPQEAAAPPAEYRLQREDVIRIVVWGEPNLTMEHAVDPEGNINVSLLGQLDVEGLTVKELVERLAEGLSKYLVDPKVQVTMIQFRKPKVYVLGQVYRPGLYEFRAGDRVMEAIAQAGSYTEMAYLEEAKLTRKGSDQSLPLNLRELFMEGDMSKNLLLEDGDAIHIPEDTMNWYYVWGEVLRPGKYRLKPNVTVVDAISMAGGPTLRGTLKGTFIIRVDPNSPERIKVDINKLIKRVDLQQDVTLKPGDVVYVPETSKPDWNKIAGIVSAVVNSSYLLRVWGL